VDISKRGFAVITACFCTVFISYAIRYSYGLLLPEMLPSLAITKTEAGIIYSSYFIAYAIFSPLLGLLADRMDIHKLLTFFSIILGIGTFLMSYSYSVIGASLFFAVAGIGAAACWSPVVALARRWVSAKRKGITLALIDIGSSIGTAVGGVVMPIVVAGYGWRMCWQGLGILAFLLVGINFYLIRNYPSDKPVIQNPTFKTSDGDLNRTTYSKIIRDLRFWLIGISYLFTAFSIIIPFTFLSTYATQELGLSYGFAARLITIISVASIVSKLALGTLSDIIGRVKLMVLCGLIMALGCLGIIYSRESLILILFAAIFGFGHGPIFALYAACASDFFPGRFTGGIIGLWTLLFGIGSILSPIFAGLIIDIKGTFSYSFLLAMMASFISLFLLMPLMKRSSFSLNSTDSIVTREL
jgi:MFS family permease